jgi:hypothetical protein
MRRVRVADLECGVGRRAREKIVEGRVLVGEKKFDARKQRDRGRLRPDLKDNVGWGREADEGPKRR